MQRDTKKNYQLYGRNDMIMLDEHNKIYGSLGLAEPYIVATKEGETLLLDGAKDNEPFIGLSIYGKSQQKTMTGAQLFDYYTILSNHITAGVVHIDADGRIILDGEFDGGNRQFSITLSPGTYTLSADAPEIWHILAPADSLFKQTLQVDEITTYECYIASGTYDRTATTPMINQGSKALPWEPYTGGQPSPNPDYPQEIVSAGDDGEIGVDVYGGNLLENIYGAKNGETVTGGKGGVNQDDYSDSTFVELPGYGHERVMQWVSSHTSGYSLYIRLFDKNKNRLHLSGVNFFSVSGQQNVHYTINVPPEVMYYCIIGENNQCTVDGIMLNIGSTALPFEPYKQPQSLIVSTSNGLPGIPVSSGGNYTDENGQQWISDEVDYRRKKYVKRTELLRITDFSEISNPTHTDLGNTEYNIQILGHYPDVQNMSHVNRSMCDSFIYSTIGDYERFAIGCDTELRVYFTLNGVLSREEFIAKIEEISPTILFPLATPIETDLTSEQITAYQSLHTNYPTTTVMNDEGAGMKAIYKQIENGG